MEMTVVVPLLAFSMVEEASLPMGGGGGGGGVGDLATFSWLAIQK